MNKIINTVKQVGQAKFLQRKDNFLGNAQLSKDLQFCKRSKRPTRQQINDTHNVVSRKSLRAQGIKLTQQDFAVLHYILKLQTEFDTNQKYQDYEEYKDFIVDREHYVEMPCEKLAKRFKCPLSTMNDRLHKLQRVGVLKAVRKYKGRGKQTLMYRVEGLEEWREARKRKEQEAETKREQKKAAKQGNKQVKTSFSGNANIKNIIIKINNIFSCSTLKKKKEERNNKEIWNIQDGKKWLSMKAIRYFDSLGDPTDWRITLKKQIDLGGIHPKYAKGYSFSGLPSRVKVKIWSIHYGQNLEGYAQRKMAEQEAAQNRLKRLLDTVFGGFKRVIFCCRKRVKEWLNDGDCPFSSNITIEQLLNCQDISEFPEHIASFLFEKFLDMTKLSRVHKSQLIGQFNNAYGSRRLY